MRTLKILIVENELLIAEDAAQRIRNLGYSVSGIAASAEEVWQSMAQDLPDIILMDIDIDGSIDGIILASQIHKKHSIPVIYLTELNDPRTANRIQNEHHAVFMNKPFNDFVLSNNIELVVKNHLDFPESGSDFEPLENAIFVKESGGVGRRIKLEFSNICYVKASRSYSEIYVRNKDRKGGLTRYDPAVSMSEVFKALSGEFLQVHRSYVVNLNYLEALYEDDIIVFGEAIPIGPSYKAEVKRRLKMI